MSLDPPDRPCAICGELVDTNDSDRLMYVDDEPAHRACAERYVVDGIKTAPAGRSDISTGSFRV